MPGFRLSFPLLLLSALLAPGCGPASAPARAPVPAPAPPPATAGHARMLEALREIRARTDQDNPYQGLARIRELEAAIQALPPGASEVDRWRLDAELADRRVFHGEEREGLAALRRCAEALPLLEKALRPGEREEFLLAMASSWMRLAETENCCASHNARSCILPLAGPALHSKPEGSRQAIAILDGVIDGTAPGTPVRLQATWLRTMAAMTLGEYPDKVPGDRRIPPEFFAGAGEFPRFENVAGPAGVDAANLAGGAIADDFDGDGRIDLFVTSWDTAGQARYFRNRGDGTFEDRTREANLEGITGGLNAIQADYDNDGAMDVLILRGAWMGRSGRQPSSLLRNDGRGVFTDRTFEAGIGDANWPCPSAVFSDYDNDGDLDLFKANEASPAHYSPCQLFRNGGDGTFTDRAPEAGVVNGRWAKSVVAGDYDGDGFEDFYVSNLGGENRLYWNRGNGTFEDVAPRLGVTGPSSSFPCWFWDYDNDGALDLMVHSFIGQPSDLAARAFGLPPRTELPSLYRGDGRGGFREVGRECGLHLPYSAMGCNFGDFDDDGFPDFYVGTGRPAARDLVPNMAYRNLRGRGFADVTLASGLGHLQKGHGIAFADFDGDGDLDVFAQMGGAYRADVFHDCLFENPGFGNHWLEVRLVGTRSNRCALGARIRAEIVDAGERRSVYRTVGSGGSFGANPMRQHLGLGQATRVERLEVHWPATGKTEVFRDLPADRLVEITEGSGKPVLTVPNPVRLGGVNAGRDGPRR